MKKYRAHLHFLDTASPLLVDMDPCTAPCEYIRTQYALLKIALRFKNAWDAFVRELARLEKLPVGIDQSWILFNSPASINATDRLSFTTGEDPTDISCSVSANSIVY